MLKSILLAFVVVSLANAQETVTSPNGRNAVTVAIKEKLEPYPSGKRLYSSVTRDGKPLLLDSPFGLDFDNMPPLARNLVIRRQEQKEIRNTWRTVAGKSSEVLDHCREMRIFLEETEAPKRQFEFIVRAYDDGIAFRYFLPAQSGIRDFALTSERTEFHFPANHTAWAGRQNNFIGSQEVEFDKVKLNDITPSNIVLLPLTIQAGPSSFLAITEANLTDWAGMYLTGTGTQPNTLVTTLSPLPKQPNILVRSTAPRYSPWRVIMTGDRPGDMIESNLILNLSEPCAIADTSWIKPGRSAWDRWWSGDYAPDATFKLGMNTETMKYFTKFAAEMGWEYVIVDWTWYGNPEDPNSDITKPIPEVDMEEIVRYAHSLKVNVLLWARWNHVNRQMEQAFPLYEKWGISGVKIDFMDSDDQEMVNFYERTLKLAAKHHLAVDFLGAYKPTGIRRTWPNLLTREGVLGNEYNKWSTRVTSEHSVTLPFTRMLAGPMDFTPGGFRSTTKANFKPRDTAPFVMGTRAHQLAMLVVYESPLQVLCDSPYSYRGQPGLEFLKVVPTTWDETKVVNGAIGEYVTIARRHGDKWYLGSMTDSTARKLEVPLNFLGKGEYKVHIYSDSPESEDAPDWVREETRQTSASETLTLPMVSGGGYAAWFEPIQ